MSDQTKDQTNDADSDTAHDRDDDSSQWEDVASELVNQRAYRAAVASFAVAVIGGFTAAAAYWLSETDTLLGVGLALSLGGIGFGLVSWAKYLDLDEHATQEREPLRTTPPEQAKLHDQVEMTKQTVGRRKLLVALLGGSFASLAVGFVGPVGSLGPRPRGERDRTGWAAGRRLVTNDGSPIGIESRGFDQLATVFPEGRIGQDDSQVVLLRLPPEILSDGTIAGGTVDGWVAYSKICTHAGCSVGLFGADNRVPETVRQLVCPCHQSVFDPTDQARPTGGPAPRSLPQLPICADGEGFLVADGDFDRPVGPIAWDEG